MTFKYDRVLSGAKLMDDDELFDAMCMYRNTARRFLGHLKLQQSKDKQNMVEVEYRIAVRSWYVMLKEIERRRIQDEYDEAQRKRRLTDDK